MHASRDPDGKFSILEGYVARVRLIGDNTLPFSLPLINRRKYESQESGGKCREREWRRNQILYMCVCVCEGIREGLPFLATEENTNRGLTDAWLSQDGKFTATGPGVIMSAVRSCNNVDIDCVGRNLRCIEDYTRNNCFSLRPADTSLVSPSLRYFYHIPFGALLRRFESNRRPFSLSLSLSRS